MKQTHIVLKVDDVEEANMGMRLEVICDNIQVHRRLEGKDPTPEYIVVNRDEPFVDEIIEVLKKHGKWDG